MRTIPLILLFFFMVNLCAAQTKKEEDIDVDYQKCVLQDSSCTNVSGCAFIAYDKWEKKMNNTYDALLRELKKEEDKTALKASQAAWLAYRSATFASYDKMFNIPGDKWCRLRHEDRIDIVRTRTLQLRTYFENLKKK
jgi:uncharacterized protein YecT (DUF1311 family)